MKGLRIWDAVDEVYLPFTLEVDPFIPALATVLDTTICDIVINHGRDAYDIEFAPKGLGDFRLYFRWLGGWDEGGWACGLKKSRFNRQFNCFDVSGTEGSPREAYAGLVGLLGEDWRKQGDLHTELLEGLIGIALQDKPNEK